MQALSPVNCPILFVRFAMLPSVAGVGDKIVLLAIVDMIAVGSACPMDYYPANGDRLTDLKFIVREAQS